MSAYVAALPMYDWPEVRAEVDMRWQRLREAFRLAGVDAPERLARRNGDLPAVPGGILDEHGQLLAPDPADLPADEFDLKMLWLHPGLLFGQTCWGPMETWLAGHVRVIGQPSYDGIKGGSGESYSSAIVMRRGDAGRDVAPPAGNGPSLPLDLLRGARLAYNDLDSMSGYRGLMHDLAAAGETAGIFKDRVSSGAHRASIRAVAEGRADVAAIDCRSWAMARRFEPAAMELRVVGWTARRKGLPYIASRKLPAVPGLLDRSLVVVG